MRYFSHVLFLKTPAEDFHCRQDRLFNGPLACPSAITACNWCTLRSPIFTAERLKPIMSWNQTEPPSEKATRLHDKSSRHNRGVWFHFVFSSRRSAAPISFTKKKNLKMWARMWNGAFLFSRGEEIMGSEGSHCWGHLYWSTTLSNLRYGCIFKNPITSLKKRPSTAQRDVLLGAALALDGRTLSCGEPTGESRWIKPPRSPLGLPGPDDSLLHLTALSL